MKIVFANEDLKNECNDQKVLVKRYGALMARLLRQRLDELFNAVVIEDLWKMPHLDISPPLLGSEDLELDIAAPYRLIFRPHPSVMHNNGSNDWKKIDSIMIMGLRK